MREAGLQDRRSPPDHLTSLSGTSINVEPSGRRRPHPSLSDWQSRCREDRATFLTWSIWVTCFYVALAVGFLLVLKHTGELKPILLHLPAYRVRLGDALGFIASFAVLMTFLMQTMFSLRMTAVLSNVLFVAYGYVGHIYPVLLLHLTLLPINLTRIVSTMNVPQAAAHSTASVRRSARDQLKTSSSESTVPGAEPNQ